MAIDVTALDVGLDQLVWQAIGERHDCKRGMLLAENRHQAAVTDVKALALEIFQILVDHAMTYLQTLEAEARADLKKWAGLIAKVHRSS
jgi:hypothetical protein